MTDTREVENREYPKSVIDGQHHRRIDPLNSLQVDQDLNHD